MTSIPFIDLQTQRKRLGASLERAIAAAVEGGQWIMGPQVRALEEQLAEFAGVKHAIACANGTDALHDHPARMGRRTAAMRYSCRPSPLPLPPKSWRWSAPSPVFVDVLEDTLQHAIPPVSKPPLRMVKREGKLQAARS